MDQGIVREVRSTEKTAVYLQMAQKVHLVFWSCREVSATGSERFIGPWYNDQ